MVGIAISLLGHDRGHAACKQYRERRRGEEHLCYQCNDPRYERSQEALGLYTYMLTIALV
jgi:hypothetical protein